MRTGRSAAGPAAGGGREDPALHPLPLSGVGVPGSFHGDGSQWVWQGRMKAQEERAQHGQPRS